MVLDIQNQQPQLLQQVHVSGGSTTFAGGHDHAAAKSWSLASLRQAIPATLDLFHTHPTSYSTSPINLEEPSPLPLGWQKFLNIKTGEIYYTEGTSWVEKSLQENTKMSRRNGSGPKLDLKLNLSPPRANPQVESPSRSTTVSPTSPPSSCLSSELNQDETLRYSNSPEATSMVLVGCPRCLMYVMLSAEDPRCPKCKSTVLLDVFNGNATNTTNKNTSKS